MRLEVTKQIEEAARRISTGKRWGMWLKEMVNLQSHLEDLQQQNSRLLAMTHELNRFVENGSRCRKRGETMNVLLADAPITESKLPTTKFVFQKPDSFDSKISLLPMGQFQCQKVPGGQVSNQSDFRNQLN